MALPKRAAAEDDQYYVFGAYGLLALECIERDIKCF